MKARTKLALEQAEIRSRLKHGRRQQRTPGPTNLRRRIAATVLIYERGWTPARIAEFFNWPLDQVTSWFEIGKALL